MINQLVYIIEYFLNESKKLTHKVCIYILYILIGVCEYVYLIKHIQIII